MPKLTRLVTYEMNCNKDGITVDITGALQIFFLHYMTLQGMTQASESAVNDSCHLIWLTCGLPDQPRPAALL